MASYNTHFITVPLNIATNGDCFGNWNFIHKSTGENLDRHTAGGAYHNPHKWYIPLSSQNTSQENNALLTLGQFRLNHRMHTDPSKHLLAMHCTWGLWHWQRHNGPIIIKYLCYPPQNSAWWCGGLSCRKEASYTIVSYKNHPQIGMKYILLSWTCVTAPKPDVEGHTNPDKHSAYIPPPPVPSQSECYEPLADHSRLVLLLSHLMWMFPITTGCSEQSPAVCVWRQLRHPAIHSQWHSRDGHTDDIIMWAHDGASLHQGGYMRIG